MQGVSPLTAIILVSFITISIAIFTALWTVGAVSTLIAPMPRLEIRFVEVYEGGFIVVYVANKGGSTITITDILVDNMPSQEIYLYNEGRGVYLDKATGPPKVIIYPGALAKIIVKVPQDLYKRLRPGTIHEVHLRASSGFTFVKLFRVETISKLTGVLAMAVKNIKLLVYPSPSNDYGLTCTTNGTYIFTAGVLNTTYGSKIIVIAYNNEGNIVWNKTISYGDISIITKLIVQDNILYALAVSFYQENETYVSRILALNADNGNILYNYTVGKNIFLMDMDILNSYIIVGGWVTTKPEKGYIAIFDTCSRTILKSTEFNVQGYPTRVHGITVQSDLVAAVGVLNESGLWRTFIQIFNLDPLTQAGKPVILNTGYEFEELNDAIICNGRIVAVGSVVSAQVQYPMIVIYDISSRGVEEKVYANYNGVFYAITSYRAYYLVAGRIGTKPGIIKIDTSLNIANIVIPPATVSGEFYDISVCGDLVVATGYITSSTNEITTFVIKASNI